MLENFELRAPQQGKEPPPYFGPEEEIISKDSLTRLMEGEEIITKLEARKKLGKLAGQKFREMEEESAATKRKAQKQNQPTFDSQNPKQATLDGYFEKK